jgi:hypothetical protein
MEYANSYMGSRTKGLHLRKWKHSIAVSVKQQFKNMLMRKYVEICNVKKKLRGHRPRANYTDSLCGLVVRVPGYRSRGPGFDSRRYQIF